MNRLSEGEIQRRIADLQARGITVLGREYRKFSGGIKLIFDVQCQCGHKWYKHVSKKDGCSKCSTYSKLSEEKIQSRIADLACRGITVLGWEYRVFRGTNQLVFDLQCQCGHKWSTKPSAFKNGCWNCYNSVPQAEIQSRIADLARRGITAVLSSKNGKTCFDEECQCGHKATRHVSEFKKGCLICEAKKTRLSEGEVQERIIDLASRGITVLNRDYRVFYQSNQLIFDVQCKCGHKWSSPTSRLKDHGCWNCTQYIPELEIQERIANLVTRGITVLSQEYLNIYGVNTLHFHVQCECGHKWSTTPAILKNSGCKKCAPSGFDPEKPAIVYYVRFGDLYKIGITNRTVRERFYAESLKPEIIEIWQFEKGADAYDFEQKVIRENAFDLYRGTPILKYTGTDEFFVRDVLGLDGVERVQQELQFAA